MNGKLHWIDETLSYRTLSSNWQLKQHRLIHPAAWLACFAQNLPRLLWSLTCEEGYWYPSCRRKILPSKVSPGSLCSPVHFFPLQQKQMRSREMDKNQRIIKGLKRWSRVQTHKLWWSPKIWNSKMWNPFPHHHHHPRRIMDTAERQCTGRKEKRKRG